MGRLGGGTTGQLVNLHSGSQEYQSLSAGFGKARLIHKLVTS